MVTAQKGIYAPHDTAARMTEGGAENARPENDGQRKLGKTRHSSNLTTLWTADIAYKKLLKILFGMCVFMSQNSYYMYKTLLLKVCSSFSTLSFSGRAFSVDPLKVHTCWEWAGQCKADRSSVVI